MKGIRIVAGSAGGLWIKVPKKFNSRPTQDRVKQAIFSILGEAVIGARTLDLFAGTGNLGIEALSRGAASCTFVEVNRACTKTIQENLTHCKLEGQICAQSAESFLVKLEDDDFSLVFLDPPYLKESTDLVRHPLANLLAEKLRPGALIAWEHEIRNTWSQHSAFDLIKHNHYGDTAVLFLRRLS